MGCIYFPFKIKIALLSPTGKMYCLTLSTSLTGRMSMRKVLEFTDIQS